MAKKTKSWDLPGSFYDYLVIAIIILILLILKDFIPAIFWHYTNG